MALFWSERSDTSKHNGGVRYTKSKPQRACPGRDFRATPTTDAVVLPNQAFAWNPSIAGTTSEDTIIALPDSVEILSAHGDWPMISIETESAPIPRPDILEL